MLAAWGAGVAAGTALVIRWAIVGPGFTWLGLGVTMLVAVPAGLAGGGVAAWIGCLAAATGLLVGRSRSVGAGAALVAAVTLLIAGSAKADPVLVIAAAFVLGGVTCEMLLGHWYLVDPRLPRSALRSLCVIGLVGSALDVAVLLAHGAVPWGAGDAVTGAGWIVLALSGILLMVAVWFALGEKGYPAVMAATGLSYLAVLTTIGAVVLGRALVTGASLG